MPKPQRPENMEYEQVKIDEWISGVIEDVQHEEKHEFTGQYAKIGPAVRFKFKLDGYQYPHYSRWMVFSYGEKANLYKKFLTPLVDGAYEWFDFEINNLKGMKVKLMYSETASNGKRFQNIELIRPALNKLKYDGKPQDALPEIQLEDQSHVDMSELAGGGEEQPF